MKYENVEKGMSHNYDALGKNTACVSDLCLI